MKFSIVSSFGNGMMARFRAGPGEAVLWIHGYTMHSDLWEPLWRLLPDCRHIGVDWPGHGATPPPTRAYTLPLIAREIGASALVHGVQHVVGLSFGAIIALQIALELPYSFKTVVLGSAGLTGGPEEPHMRDRYLELVRLYRERGAGPWMTAAWMKSPPDIFTGTLANAKLRHDLIAAIDCHSWSELGNGFMRSLTEYRQIDHLDDITRIGSAMLLLIGEGEMPTFRKAAELIQDSAPCCRTVQLPATGHLTLLEAPETVSAIIGNHLLCHAAGTRGHHDYRGQ
jgi:pimeloyl-ACP methyl ester carboxylesterase